MRLLAVHADRFAFEAALPADEDGAETGDAPREGRMEDGVVAFVGVAADDRAGGDALVADAAEELRGIADQLNAGRVALYPRPALVEEPADLDDAKAVLRDLEAALDADLELLRAPVGWHNSFEIAGKGHPYAEQVRTISPGDGGEPPAVDERYVLAEDGERDDSADGARIGPVTVDGAARTPSPGADPFGGVAARLRERGLAVPGDAGDAVRWTPRGTVLRDAVVGTATERMIEFGAAPADAARASGSGAEGRPEPCATHLSLLAEASVDAADLPLRFAGTATAARGCSQRAGDGSDAARTVPAMHAATADLDAAKREFERQVDLALSLLDALDLDAAPIFRTTRAFRDEHREWVDALPETVGRKVVVELLADRRDGAAATMDLVAGAGNGDGSAAAEPIATASVTIDPDSAERFGAVVEGGTDGRRHPVVVHCAPLGSVEAALAVLTERAARRDPPRYPTRLAPTQVRFVPIGDEHVEHCERLADRARSAGVRADVDDRPLTVGERVERAREEWVPYYAAVGDRELAAETLPVAVRATGEEIDASVDELIERVNTESGGGRNPGAYPPKRVSRRPAFEE